MKMMELAQALAQCDSSFFGGWILAGTDVHITGEASSFGNKLLLHKRSRSIFQAYGLDDQQQLVKELRAILVLPQGEAKAAAAEPVQPDGELVFSHSFTLAEVAEYVQLSGDENIIHKGENPLVPGICMAWYLQRQLQLKELDWSIRYLRPVYTQQLLQIYQQTGFYTAYVDQIPVFKIKYKEVL